MDLNLPDIVGGEAGVEEKVTQEEAGKIMELVKGEGESSFCRKGEEEEEEEEEEKEVSKAEGESSSGVVVTKRASTRTWSLLATEKIEKLKEEVYEWEYDRKKRRKSHKTEVEGHSPRERESRNVEIEDSGLGGEGKVVEENVEDQRAKERPERKRKVFKSADTGLGVETEGEKKIVEGQGAKRRRGRPRKVGKSEDSGLGVEAEGQEKIVEGQGAKRKRGRKRKVVKSEDTGLVVEAERQGKNVEGQGAKRKPGRKRKDGKSEDSGLVGGEAEGEEKNVEEERLQRTLRRTERTNWKSEGTVQSGEKNVEGQCTDLAEQEVVNDGDGRDVFVDNEVEPIHCTENISIHVMFSSLFSELIWLINFMSCGLSSA